jgi:flagellar P-ring protein precursor FlgI
MHRYSILIVALFLSLNPVSSSSQTKLSDLVEIQDARSIELVGYGLVTGLDRTGDRSISRRGATFTVQSIANMLQTFGINVDVENLRTRNVAAVMVTARISPYNATGSALDVAVSSLGDANSLQGGLLLQTPLIDPQTQQVYAYAQGPLIIGSLNAEVPGARVAQNQSLTATIPNGGSVIYNESYVPDRSKPLNLSIQRPNYTNAQRMADVINATFEQEIAEVAHAGLLNIEWPDNFQDTGDLNFFTSMVLDLEIEVDVPARVVINERTGTIVAGGDVTIGEVLISHGNVQVQTQANPFVSQPPAFSGGQTIVGNINTASIREESAQNLVLEANTRVTELATSLNNLGLSPRDIIAIFQAIDQAGALKGKLIII